MRPYTLTLSLLVAISSGCATKTSVVVNRLESSPMTVSRHTEGVEQSIWEEPMIDVIDVPPGLDPEGHYYRPGHQEVVEIRQGRWKYYGVDGVNNE